MVKVQIPVDIALDEDDENAVGIMSDVESDVDDEIGDPDWEEVKTNKDDNDEFSFKPGSSGMPSTLPTNGITISIGRQRPKRGGKKRASRNNNGSDDEDDDWSGEEVVSKKKKRPADDLQEYIRKKINRVKITEQLMRHKFSLLCYLARGLRLVKVINCNIIQGLSLSILDNRFRIPKKSKQLNDRKLLELFMDQFNDVVEINSDDDVRSRHMQQPFMLNLLECYKNCETTSLIELVVMFVACLKALRPKLPMRVVNVLRPITTRADIIPKDSTPPPPIKGEIEEITIEDDDDTKEKKNGKGKKRASKAKATQSSDRSVVLDKDRKIVVTDVVEKLDFWVEVFLADEKKWCCVDLCNAKLDEPTVLTELSRPFHYLVSYDVDRNCIKPAEKNYCADWYTPAFRKERGDDRWWDRVMELLGPDKRSDRDLADENKFEEVLTNQEMPTNDGGFRNHPLYVLEKHLLKFQGIYPPEVAPLGFFKEQPVYPRDCVHTLRSRETWLRQARTVKLNETAYKVVKARPKRDKYTGNLIRDLPLELFGEWQTTEYEPPQASDGKVPRNAYGNVDMYQECMLPKGCVWLKLAGLQRVANKLGIDCAQAVVGFDNHCGSYGAHPVIDGSIVCQEYEETLRMAWEEEQANMTKREEDKRQKRIWDNWKRLLKAAMIREKLRVKYKHS